jgi:hypothetical protein
MKTISPCIVCRKPLSRGVHEFSQSVYGHSLCMKDQYLIGESGATAQVVDLYLALKSRNFPVVLGHFDGCNQVDLAIPDKLHIEVYETYHQVIGLATTHLTGIIRSSEKKIPTIVISHAMIDNPDTFIHVVNELSKACKTMLKPIFEFSVACAPPFTAAQLQ